MKYINFIEMKSVSVYKHSIKIKNYISRIVTYFIVNILKYFLCFSKIIYWQLIITVFPDW